MRAASTKPSNQVPPPPVWRLLLIPVSVTLLTVLVIFGITVLRYNELIIDAQAASPATPMPPSSLRYGADWYSGFCSR